MQIAGKTVVITGGGTGIGREITKKLYKQEAKIVICGRRMAPLNRLARELPGLKVIECDVTTYDQVEKLRDFCLQEFGCIDVLINNAAVFRRFDILDESYGLEAQLEELDINLAGPIIVTHVFLPELLMREESVIVNLTSPSAFLPMVKAPIYSATKAALQSWTLSLREQLKSTNVKVIDLNPPAVDTQMNENNPGVEGMTLMSPSKFADIFVEGFAKGKAEIMPSHAGIMRVMRRVAPNFTFKMLNKKG